MINSESGQIIFIFLNHHSLSYRWTLLGGWWHRPSQSPVKPARTRGYEVVARRHKTSTWGHYGAGSRVWPDLPVLVTEISFIQLFFKTAYREERLQSSETWPSSANLTWSVAPMPSGCKLSTDVGTAHCLPLAHLTLSLRQDRLPHSGCRSAGAALTAPHLLCPRIQAPSAPEPWPPEGWVEAPSPLNTDAQECREHAKQPRVNYECHSAIALNGG